MFRLVKRAPWVVLGAAAAFYADPASGITRRRRLRSRIEALLGDAVIGRPTVAVNGSAPEAARTSDGFERRRSEDTVDPFPDAVPLGDPRV